MKRISKQVMAGNVKIGGGAPVTVQSMLNVPSTDIEGSVRQAVALEKAGCQILRAAIPDMDAVRLIPAIKEKISIPLVADIHFDYKLALEAAAAGVDKIRINPGNIGDWAKVDAVIDAAGASGCAIRIGVNAGSLEQDIAEREELTQPEKLVMSSERFVKHFEDRGFTNIVLSAKAHSVQTTLDTYRALSREIPHVPLHLGVTEAGTKLQGTIKSSVGLGILLSEGIGDTMRVSLTADPVEEPPVAWGILQSLGLRRRGPEIVSCPTCARCQVDLIPIAEEVTERLKNYSAPLSIAVMGCAVNGPGEASDADLGVACGRGQALLFSHGQIIGKVAEDQIVDALMAEVDKLIEEK